VTSVGGATPWPIYGNDKLGDRSCAAAAHMIEVWTANAPHLIQIPEPAVIDVYRHFNPGTRDAGCKMLEVLRSWRRATIAGHDVHAFVSLDLADQYQATEALSLFGSVYIGLALPDFAFPQNGNPLAIPWSVPPTGAVGTGAPNPLKGHCVCAVAYDSGGLSVVTWGTLKSMTWEFYSAYADEAYAVLSLDWFSCSGEAPTGFDMPTLNRDLRQLARSSPHS
jgi:hypothetical protein